MLLMTTPKATLEAYVVKNSFEKFGFYRMGAFINNFLQLLIFTFIMNYFFKH